MFDYKNVGDKTHLIYTLKEGDKIDDVTKNVLLHNKIDGLTAFSVVVENGSEQFIYDVSSMVSLHHYLNNNHSEKETLGFVRDIASIAQNVDNYLANSDDIVTGLDYIFINTYTKKVSLVLLPILRENNRAIFGLFEQIADRLDNNNYSIGARLKGVLHSYDNFSLEQFIVFIDSILQEIGGNSSANSNAQTSKLVAEVVDANNIGEVNDPTNTNNDILAPTSTPTSVVNLAPTAHAGEVTTPNTAPESKSSSVSASVQRPHNLTNLSVNDNQVNIRHNASQISEPEKVSLFALLMHYSKENAMKRKLWKEWLKSQKSEQKSDPKQSTEKIAKPKKQKGDNINFATPSKPANENATVSAVSDTADRVTEWQKTSTTFGNADSMPEESIASPRASIQTSEGNFAANNGRPVGAFGATQYLASNDDNSGKTTLLVSSNSDTEKNEPGEALESKTTIFGKLISQKDGSEIIISKPSFSIGRAADCVDSIINNTNISGVHAVIESNIAEQKYYITDTNSRNHVFINDMQITPSERAEIKDGSVISFADEKYEFRTT